MAGQEPRDAGSVSTPPAETPAPARAQRAARRVQAFSTRVMGRMSHALTDGAEWVRLKASSQRSRVALERAYRDLGKEVYHLHRRAGDASPFANLAELKPELERVDRAADTYQSDRAELARIRSRRKNA